MRVFSAASRSSPLSVFIGAKPALARKCGGTTASVYFGRIGSLILPVVIIGSATTSRSPINSLGTGRNCPVKLGTYVKHSKNNTLVVK